MAKQVLLVEDYANVVEILKMRLEAAGFQVLTASDGQQGLNMARSHKPDLIILDIMLPKLNGYKVCRFLKFDAKYRHIPIFMLTSRSKKSDEEIGRQTGADEYILKPYDPKKMMTLVFRYLGVPRPS